MPGQWRLKVTLNGKPPIRFRLRLDEKKPRKNRDAVVRVIITLLGVLFCSGGLVLSVALGEHGLLEWVPLSGLVAIVGFIMMWFGLLPSEATFGELVAEILIQLILGMFF